MNKQTDKGMFVVFSGLPGSGKTTISKALAHKINAVHLRIDTIEQALKNFNTSLDVTGEGYVVACEIARDNLKNGHIVIADSVNPVSLTREMYEQIGRETGSALINIEVFCSDKSEHRRRIEERKADIKGHRMPTWHDVLNREYDEWNDSNVICVDSGVFSTAQCVAKIIEYLEIK
jgi:predicted kinase